MKKYLLVFIVIVFKFSISKAFSNNTNYVYKERQYPYYKDMGEIIYSYKIFKKSNSSFGYDIYKDGIKLIHQPSIPSLPKNDGFKTKNDAEKVARLVIQKLKLGLMPPSVSQDELIAIGILK